MTLEKILQQSAKKILRLILLSLIIMIILLGGIILFFDKEPQELNNTYIEMQTAQENIIKAEFNEKDNTMDSPLIAVNPYGTNELSAYVAFNSETKYKYEYTVPGKTEDTSFTYSSEEFENKLIIPVVGLYANVENKVHFKFTDEEGNVKEKDYSIKTEFDDKNAEIDVKDVDDYEKFMNNSLIVDNYAYGYDKNGDIRIAGLTTKSWYGTVKLYNGHILIPETKGNSTLFTSVYNVNLMGRANPDFKLDAPSGYVFHHDMTVVGDELYALVAPYNGVKEGSSLESEIAVYSSTGELKEIINLSGQFFDDDLVAGNSNPNDMHLNSIDYLESENELILSSRSYSRILAYNLGSKNIDWIIDDPKTVGKENQQYLLKAINDVNWTSGQHTVNVLDKSDIPAGSYQENHIYLSVFDNQSCVEPNQEEVTKTLDDEVVDCNTLNAQGLIYELDLENKTVKQIKKTSSEFSGEFTGLYSINSQYQEMYTSAVGEYQMFDLDGNVIFNMYIPKVEKNGLTENEPFTYRAQKITANRLKEKIDNF